MAGFYSQIEMKSKGYERYKMRHILNTTKNYDYTTYLRVID
jgi:hypothetical protein